MTRSTGEGATLRRRGRPFRLPEDPTPLREVHGGANKRVSWLLACCRIYAADPALAHRERFVEALREIGVPADQARVSRWESGQQRVPDRVLAAYEQVLGLRPGRISAVANGLRRALEPDSPEPETVLIPPAEIHAELDRLFARAYDVGHGSDWLALTTYLATHRNVYLRPRDWTELAETLVVEMCRSTDAALARRFEALRMLIRHPGAQRHVIKAIGAFVTDPAAQSVITPLALLQEVDHPRAQDLALRLLSGSTGILQEGAAWVTASKLARGQFDAGAVRQLEGLCVLMIAAGPRAMPDVDIFDVAAQLPEEARTRVVAAVRDTDDYGRLETLLHSGEILPASTTLAVSVEMADHAQRVTPPPYRIEPDLMLQRLIREALFHGHQERRFQAAVLLSVSPYRAGVAAACVPAASHRDPAVRRAACMLLRHLATEAERPQLRRWARSPEQVELCSYSLIALGRLKRGLTPTDEEAIMETLQKEPSTSVRRACVYALGMGGSGELKRLAREGTPQVRTAARWWLDVGPAIHETPNDHQEQK